MMAGMIFNKEPFFKGDDNYDQLVKIARVLGTEELVDYLEKYGLRLEPEYNGRLGYCPRKDWSSFITEENRHLVERDSLEFLDCCLKYDHVSSIQAERITPKDAQTHPYFHRVVTMYDKLAQGAVDYAPTDPEYETAQVLLAHRE